jgi:hypothetical protein
MKETEILFEMTFKKKMCQKIPTPPQLRKPSCENLPKKNETNFNLVINLFSNCCHSKDVSF